MTGRSRLLVALVVAASLAACARAPGPESERAARRAWDEYLASRRGQFAQHAGTPSRLWDAEEQARWPMFDLAGFHVPDGAEPEVLSATPVDAAVDSAYRIVTRFWPQGAAARDTARTPLLTVTVYARRSRGTWVLANALGYHTSAWVRETRGRITYRVAPALRFDGAKAAGAAAFVDSLAAAFGVAPPPRLEYYATESVDQALEIMGVVGPSRYGAAGGFAKPVNFQVFSGIPALGEAYRHELAHVVLLPIVRASGTSLLASEGVSTWFGGTAGRDYRGSVRLLDSALVAQPQLTLDRIVDDMRVASDLRNAAGAVLAELVHEAGGRDAVVAYMQAPGHDMREVLERMLRGAWGEVAQRWRERVRRIAER